MDPLTLNVVLSRPCYVSKGFLDDYDLDPRWASHLYERGAHCCECQAPYDSVEERGDNFFWVCPRHGIWLLVGENEPLPNYLREPFSEFALATRCGVSWGDFCYDVEQAELALISAEEKAARAAVRAAEEAANAARAAAAAALLKKEFHTQLAQSRFKHGDFRRVMSKRTGLPVKCKWDSQPAGNGFEAGCADHRNHVCPFFHSNEPEWADAIPAARGDYTDPRFIGIRGPVCEDRGERRPPQRGGRR